MAVLDCESYESSVKSISNLYRVSASRVVSALKDIDLDLEYEKGTKDVSASELLLRIFESHVGSPVEIFQTVYWFHLTRVLPETDFGEGILPLHDALTRIWDTIVSIPDNPRTKANLRQLQKSGVPDYHYSLKTGNRLHSGPYAMLVRESAFSARSMLNHDYLAFPEIIEDICNGYQKKFGERLHEEVSAALRPCIVKFEVSEEGRKDLIEPALNYCWHKEHGEDLSFGTNTCYDGSGKLIPRSAIRKIEFP